MDTSASPALVVLHLLADRTGNLAGLLIDPGPGTTDSLLEFAAQPEFTGLTEQLPCLYISDAASEGSASTEPAYGTAFEAAGCRAIASASLHASVEELEFEFDLDPDLDSDIEWVSGDWYMVPPAWQKGSQVASRGLALQLVQLVAADADTREIEAVFRRDPTLSYHLMRLVNSLSVGPGRKITSFSQAILILGRQQLRRWLNLMLFAARDDDKRSAMLLARVAVRARSMELLAKASGLDKPAQEQAFMAGMFSMLGTLFGMPPEEVLRPLMISDALRSAVLAREGDLGRLLVLVEAEERADFATLENALANLHLTPASLNLAIVEAHNWMLGVARQSGGSDDG